MAVDDADVSTHGTAPLSWRDVYAAVGDSRQEILQAIAEAVKPLADRQADHEQRLRSIELGQTPWQTNMRVAHDKHGERLGSLESTVSRYNNREIGIAATLSAGQKIVASVGIILGAILAVLSIIVIVSGLAAGLAQ